MSDYDKSLEDIIKERKFVKKPRNSSIKAVISSAKGQRQAGRIQKTAEGLVTKKKTKLFGRMQIPIEGLVTMKRQQTLQKQMATFIRSAGGQGQFRQLQDARTKINQKKRVKVKDAREMLSKKSTAQITDARDKLNKKASVDSEKMELSWMMEDEGFYSTWAPKQLPLMSRHTIPATPDHLTRTVKNSRPVGNSLRNIKKPNDRQKQVVFTKGGLTIIKKQRPAQKRSNDSTGSALFARTFGAFVKEKSREPSAVPQKWPRNAVALHETKKFNDDYDDDIVGYEEDDGVPEYVPTQRADNCQNVNKLNKATPKSYNKADMATSSDSALPNISHGLQMRLGANESAPANQLGGYKIRVTNLHLKVTNEDLKELFGDVGVLHNVVLYKQGIADVIYARLADAKKAIDNYHDRELDGQPMMCKLMNPPERLPESRLSKFLRTGTLHSDRISGGAGLTATAAPATAKSRIKPDVNAIRNALFHSNTPLRMPSNRHASITVTL